MTQDEFRELAAGHALHALSPADEAAFSRMRAAHPEWADEADRAAATAAALGDAIVAVEPPAGIRGALLARIADLPQGDEGAGTLRQAQGPDAGGRHAPLRGVGGRKPRGTRRLFALAASFVVLLGLSVGALQLTGVFAPPVAVTALDQIQRAPDAQQAQTVVAEGGTATAHWSASLGEAVLVVDGVAALPADRTYELWYVRDSGAVPAGTFDPERGDATALLSGAMQPGDTIAVTVEDAGGSPSGSPTTTPILAIPTA